MLSKLSIFVITGVVVFLSLYIYKKLFKKNKDDYDDFKKLVKKSIPPAENNNFSNKTNNDDDYYFKDMNSFIKNKEEIFNSFFGDLEYNNKYGSSKIIANIKQKWNTYIDNNKDSVNLTDLDELSGQTNDLIRYIFKSNKIPDKNKLKAYLFFVFIGQLILNECIKINSSLDVCSEENLIRYMYYYENDILMIFFTKKDTNCNFSEIKESIIYVPTESDIRSPDPPYCKKMDLIKLLKVFLELIKKNDSSDLTPDEIINKGAQF